jgi:chromosome segregation and condensation protein ScpB
VFIAPKGLRIVMGCRTFNSFEQARQHFTDPNYSGGSKGKVEETLAAIAYAETVTKLRISK